MLDSPPTATPLREQNRLNAKQNIQRAAFKLFSEYGYSNVTVELVAEHAGVGPATVYRHFGTKENIITWTEPLERLQQADWTMLASSEGPVDTVRQFLLNELACCYRNDYDLMRVQAMFNVPEIYKASAHADLELIKRLVEASGDVHPELDQGTATTLAFACVSAFSSALYLWQLNAGKTPIEELIGEAFTAIEVNWS